MAGRQRIYKVDVKKVEKDIALLKATKKVEPAKQLEEACKNLSIPLDQESIKEQFTEFQELAKLLK